MHSVGLCVIVRCNSLFETPQTRRAVPLIERALCLEIFLFRVRTLEKFHCRAVLANRGKFDFGC